MHDPNNGAYVILYADDILLMSHSISTLQTLLTTCENELDTIGMAINTRKSCCIRVGPRHNIPCAAINTNDGSKLLWSEVISWHFHCSMRLFSMQYRLCQAQFLSSC